MPDREGVRAVKCGPSDLLTPEIHVGPAEEQRAMRAEARIRADERQHTLRKVEAWLRSRAVGTARINDFHRAFGATTDAE